jgi:hypothetical protein
MQRIQSFQRIYLKPVSDTTGRLRRAAASECRRAVLR